MQVKEAIQTGDVEMLDRLLAEDPSRANELILWGPNDKNRTHPLHYVSDMLFAGLLPMGKELPLIEALVEAGADLDFQRAREDGRMGDTPLIGAASLAAEEVGFRLLEAGARPDLRGIFGETALHWAALLGQDRLVGKLIEGSDLDLKDDEYSSSPLGWAIHGRYNSSAGNKGRQCEVAAKLVAAGAKVDPNWLARKEVGDDPPMLAALRLGKLS